MSPISGPSDGPVAVTGASGYIGSHVVKNLVRAGYTVRACVRDASREDKVSVPALDRTLTNEDVDVHMAKIVTAIQSQLGAEIRE